MKKFLLILAAAACLGFTAQQAKAQSYNKAIGLGVSSYLNVNYKQFFSPTSAIEGGLAYSFVSNSPMIWAVYEYHVSIVDNLNFYFGGGLNLGAYNVKHNTKFALGLDPIVGIEYKFNNAPIALAFDYKPELNLTGAPMGFDGVSLKVRYTF